MFDTAFIIYIIFVASVYYALKPSKKYHEMTAERWEELNPGQPYPLNK